MRGIAVIGAESSGKTSLCEYLSSSLQLPFVKEYAREFLEQSKGKYSQADLTKMARRQYNDHLKMEEEQNGVWFADTEAMTIKGWSLEKYGNADPHLDELISNQPFDHYLLCAPDLKWEYDPLREVPNIKDRERIFDMMKNELNARGFSYFIVSGMNEARYEAALNNVKKLF